MNDVTISSNVQLILLVAVAALSAIAASGLTTLTLIVFFRNLLNSPAALKLVEGLVDSFPPDTRELINVIARFVETVSDNQNPPTPSSQAQTAPSIPPPPPSGSGAAKVLRPDVYSTTTVGYPAFLEKRLSSLRERVQP